MFERMVALAIRDHVFWRRNYHPADPTHITEAIKRSDEYLQAMDALQEGLDELLAFLKNSVPFFSMRYQGHMNWDLTIPGMLGYFATMLYNPNNVAFEGSTATTFLELLVGVSITGAPTDANLLAVSNAMGALLVDGVLAAPVTSAYYSQVAAAMIQADQARNAGRYRAALTTAFVVEDFISHCVIHVRITCGVGSTARPERSQLNLADQREIATGLVMAKQNAHRRATTAIAQRGLRGSSSSELVHRVHLQRAATNHRQLFFEGPRSCPSP
jgi:hypothetical protein